MAGINVNEKDLSWYSRQSSSNSLTVLIFGFTKDGPLDSRPVLCSTPAELDKVFGGPLDTLETDSQFSMPYHMAKSLLTAGCRVLFQRLIGSEGIVKHLKVINSANSALGGDVYIYTNEGSVNPDKINVVVNHIDLDAGSINAQALTPWAFHVEVRRKSDDYLMESGNFYIPRPTDPKGNLRGSMSNGDVVVVKAYDTSSLSLIRFVLDGDDGTRFNDDRMLDSSNWSFIEDTVNKPPVSLNEDGVGLTADRFSQFDYDIDVVIPAGLEKIARDTGSEDVPVISLMREIVQSRQDCIYIHEGYPQSPKSYYRSLETFNSSYEVGVGPWCYCRYLHNGATELLPGSYPFLISWARSISRGVAKWITPAGVKRSLLSGDFFIKPQYETTMADYKAIYPDSDDGLSTDVYRVNPIMKIKNYGYCIFGNSTLLHTGLSTSSLQMLSVRVISNLIKKKSVDVALSLSFDQLTGDLFAQFRTLVGAYLDELKYQGALYDYRISLTDSSYLTIGNLAEKRVPVTIRISPNPSAENFDISLEIAQSGINFSDDTYNGSTSELV